ncbi:asaB [Symbiodinium microadriaticum]|nr:asaB [Symbiodinium sp. KB8]CAE7885240.1 asaB [Symbiodinium microadriaticum]
MREADACAAASDGVVSKLPYQKLVPGKRTGRYIRVPDIGELADEHEQHSVYLRNGRGVEATLETTGFELRNQATQCTNFFDPAAVATIYYPEVEALVKHSTGCADVIVFDHTIRESGATGLNVLSETSQAAAPVMRVHTDYTDESAPRRLRDLARSESYTGMKLSEEDCERILSSRYCFINVWKSIAEEPATRCPLAVCDAKSVDYSRAIKYEMHFPDRIGSNYALEFSPQHRWYYYPRMGKDESLLFKVFEKDASRTQSVFHTAFHDPTTPADAPTRRSIECRTIACFAESENGKCSYQPLQLMHVVMHSNKAASTCWHDHLACSQNAPAMKQILESNAWRLPAQVTVSFIAAPGKHRPDELNVERLISQLPPPLKKHLWLKTPNLRRKLAGQAQQLIDAAIEDDPENGQMIKAAIRQGVDNLNHEADLHPLEFQQSLKDMERIERALKVHSMQHVLYCSWNWLPKSTKRRNNYVLRAFL